MVTIEENHTLLDIILGYTKEGYLNTYLEVCFLDPLGLNMDFTLISPSGKTYKDISIYKLREKGVWLYRTSLEGYIPYNGSITVDENTVGKYITIDLTMDQVPGEVLVNGTARYINIEGGTISYGNINLIVGLEDIYKDNSYSLNKKIPVSGSYSYYDDFSTGYRNIYSIGGYKPLTYYYETYLSNRLSLDEVLLINDNITGNGSIKFNLHDSKSGGNVYGNMFCECYNVWGYSSKKDGSLEPYNTWSLGTVTTITLNNIATGYYTFKIWGDYYEPIYVNAIVLPDMIYQTKEVFLIPTMLANGLTAVLTWGAEPNDLDSHLLAYRDGTQITHVYYSNKNYTGSDGKVHINLDVDDTTSYGPETISIYYLDPGFTYYYYIYDYSGTKGIPSEARITLYDNGTQLFTITPDNTFINNKNYRFWKVFSYSATTKEISVRNKIVNYTPTEENWESD